MSKARCQLLAAMSVTALVMHVIHQVSEVQQVQVEVKEVEVKESEPPYTPHRDSNEIVLKLNEMDRLDMIPIDNSPRSRLDARKKHLLKVCANLTLSDTILEQRTLEITMAYGKLKLCGLEKTASTFMRSLRYREDTMNFKRQKAGLSPYKSEDGSYKTFIIVREPYGRLLSAYIDKLYSRSSWWGQGKYIIENFRYHATHQSKQCGSDVSFAEFIRYWIHSQETDLRGDGHFNPMHRECQFCHFDYDYYVHMETIQKDMEFVYKETNTTLIRAMDDEEFTMRDKAADIIKQRDSGAFRGCEEVCAMLDRAWWTFHARGLIASDVPQPLKEDQCVEIEQSQFEDLVWKSHVESKERIDKVKQRRQAMVDLYLTVPLLDRLKVRNILLRDFNLHGYESLPMDMFPELERNHAV